MIYRNSLPPASLIALTLLMAVVSQSNNLHAAGKASAGKPANSVSIELTHDDPASRARRDQLNRLLSAYDLSKWTFTQKIMIDSGSRVIPHSHPVLTLTAGHEKDDELLLATFVHEQLHWFIISRPEKRDAAFKELRALFPEVPVGYPEGARDEESTYRHLIVCYLEYQAVRELLGELRARQVIDFWAHHHYQWIYRTVLEDPRKIGKVVRKHGLFP